MDEHVLAARRVVPEEPTRRARGDSLLAGLLVVLIAWQREIFLSLTIGTIAALACTPLWLTTLSRYRGARLLALCATVAALAGLWLTHLSSLDHRTSFSRDLFATMMLVNIVVGVGVLLWARLQMHPAHVALLFGVGMLLGVNPGERFAENAWRFGFSVPVTFLLLSIAWRTGKRWLEVAAALVLASVTALNGGRSTFAMLLLAALLVVWQLTTARTRRQSRARVVLLAGGVLFSIYQIGQGLILDGYLGEDTQQRTEEQIEASGNVLLGGRPEMGATLALVAENPLGFGGGTLPNGSDVVVAKGGMAALGYEPDNGYVHNYMFGGGIELHSVLGDAWASYGALGALFAVLMLGLTASSVVALIARRAAPLLLVFLAVRMAWNIFFSPLFSSQSPIIATLGLLLPLAIVSGGAVRSATTPGSTWSGRA